MSRDALAQFVAAKAKEFDVPGIAVGVWVEGREVFACHGVTSVDNPLPVDPDTLFVLGSVTKTYTATAIMRLVEAGRVELDAPVRRYVPELRLPDKEAAAQITILNLLNHTAGLDTRMVFDSGDGDDALAGRSSLKARVASGGTSIINECVRPCHSASAARRPPMLPILLPPYVSPSVLMISR